MSLTTYVQRGDIIDYTPGANVSAGDIVVFGELIGQVCVDALSGVPVGLRVEGVIKAPCLSTDTPAVGAKLYWDAGNSRLTTTASTHKQAGWAIEAKASGVTTVLCRLGKG
jgi:predicted RecA/RadA family phage recombinase